MQRSPVDYIFPRFNEYDLYGFVTLFVLFFPDLQPFLLEVVTLFVFVLLWTEMRIYHWSILAVISLEIIIFVDDYLPFREEEILH